MRTNLNKTVIFIVVFMSSCADEYSYGENPTITVIVNILFFGGAFLYIWLKDKKRK